MLAKMSNDEKATLGGAPKKVGSKENPGDNSMGGGVVEHQVLFPAGKSWQPILPTPFSL